MSMTPCKNCSNKSRGKTVYHVGDCPKGPWIEIPPLVDFSAIGTLKAYEEMIKTSDEHMSKFMSEMMIPAKLLTGKSRGSL